MTNGALAESWRNILGPYLATPEMDQLRTFLRDRLKHGARIYPPKENWFAALNATPFDEVKVVILGQDPYHGAGQAHGLAFSVPVGTRIPPSLVNIYKELRSSMVMDAPTHGNLTDWAEQGVLLLNAVLTVEDAQPGAHVGKGWEGFTDEIIRQLNDHRENLVFMLWGSYAQAKGKVIDRTRHCVLTAPHPSPLSAHRGFLGCDHFGKANRYLRAHGQKDIDWSRLTR